MSPFAVVAPGQSLITVIGFQAYLYFAKLCRERDQGYALRECPHTWHDAGYMRLYCVCRNSGTPSANMIVFSDSDALGSIRSDRFAHFLEERHSDRFRNILFIGLGTSGGSR